MIVHPPCSLAKESWRIAPPGRGYRRFDKASFDDAQIGIDFEEIAYDLD